jgi:hypothetical protein
MSRWRAIRRSRLASFVIRHIVRQVMRRGAFLVQ